MSQTLEDIYLEMCSKKNKSEEKKAKVTDKLDDGDGMDPVGKADADIDNDGDVDSSDNYLKNRRKAIKKSMKEAAGQAMQSVLSKAKQAKSKYDNAAQDAASDSAMPTGFTGQKADHKSLPVDVDDTEEKGHDDSTKVADKVSSKAGKRSNDKEQGDAFRKMTQKEAVELIPEASLTMKIAARGNTENKLKKLGGEAAEQAAFLVNQAEFKKLEKFLKTVSSSERAKIQKILDDNLKESVELDEKMQDTWTVELPNLKKKVPVRARNSTEALKKAAKRAGVDWRTVKVGKIQKESVELGETKYNATVPVPMAPDEKRIAGNSGVKKLQYNLDRTQTYYRLDKFTASMPFSGEQDLDKLKKLVSKTTRESVDQVDEKKYKAPTPAEIAADKKKDQKGKARPSITAKSTSNKVYKNYKEEVELDEADLRKMSTAKLQKMINDAEDERVSPVYGAQVKRARAELAKRKKVKKEEVEQVDEVSKGLLQRYKKAANNDRRRALDKKDIAGNYTDMDGKTTHMSKWDDDDREAYISGGKRAKKRDKGIAMAQSKTARKGQAKVRATEEVEQIDEGMSAEKILGSKPSQRIKSKDQWIKAAKGMGLVVKSPSTTPDGDNNRDLFLTAFDKNGNMKGAWYKTDGVFKESAEQIDELSKKTLGSYIKKANRDGMGAARVHRSYDGNDHATNANLRTMKNRKKGVDRAVDKLTREEVELDESHFSVGDTVKCKASGMKGKVVKVDKPEEGKYYTVKTPNGEKKYAPDELMSLREAYKVPKNYAAMMQKKRKKAGTSEFGSHPDKKKEKPSK